MWLLTGSALVVGFLTGIAVDDALDMLFRGWRRSTRKEHPMTGNGYHLTELDDDRDGARPPWRTVLVWALLFVVLLNTALGVLLIVQREQTQRATERATTTAAQLLDLTSCVATYQRDFGEAYSARAEAANQASRALDQLIFAVAADDRRRFRNALDEYVRIRRDQEDDRAANPLPPTTLCGVPASD